MRILLLSAYDAASHQRWHQGLLAALPAHQWQVLTLSPRFFNWRIRGNSLYWAFAERQILDQGFDLILATSMVDLATLKGLVPSLALTPAIVYFHENQFAYPANNRQHPGLEPQMVNLYSALAADSIVFNSDYNRQSFIAGVAQLLKKLPDAVPAGIEQTLLQRSLSIPVPLEADCYRQHQPRLDSPLHIVWNHRWEYDKGPDRLLALIQGLVEKNIDCAFSILGERFRRVPGEFEQIKSLLMATNSVSLKHWGFVPELSDYRQLLATADVVLSTALHDFQGLSVMEAVAAGCLPLVPDRLCYRQWFPAASCYPSFPAAVDKEVKGVLGQLIYLAAGKKAAALPLAPSVTDWSWLVLGQQYQRLLSDVVAQAGSLYDRRPQ